MKYGFLWLLVILSGCVGDEATYRFKSIVTKEHSTLLKSSNIYIGMQEKELVHLLGIPNIISYDKKQRKSLIFALIDVKLIYTKVNLNGRSVPSLQIEKEIVETDNEAKVTLVVKLDKFNNIRDFSYF